MALLDTLVGELVGPKSVDTLSKSTGADATQIQHLVTSALPVLLSSMHQNASTPDGAASLATALDKHAEKASHSTSAMLQNADQDDGKKIVKHVLGDNTDQVTKQLAKSSGMNAEQVTTILATLAPVVLSLLGSHKQETKKDASSDGLTSMLMGALLGGNSSGKSGLDLGSIASALLGGGENSGTGSASGGLDLGGIASALLGGGKQTDHSKHTSNASGGLDLGGIASALLGGSGGHSKKENTSDALSNLLSGLLK